RGPRPAHSRHLDPGESSNVATLTALAGGRTETIASRPRRTPLGDAIRTLKRKPVAMAGLLVVLAWLLLGILAPVLPIQEPDTVQIPNRLKPPGAGHIFGTDDVGREMTSRVIYGARVSLPAGIAVIVLTGTFGCIVGAIAGYFGGVVDSVIMRTSDAILSFP